MFTSTSPVPLELTQTAQSTEMEEDTNPIKMQEWEMVRVLVVGPLRYSKRTITSWVHQVAVATADWAEMGGSDDPLNIAVGGCVTGTPSGSDIEMGSSAGSADYGVGGAGGASLRVTAEAIDIAGEITMNGEDGTTYTGRNGGGGAGGGILLDAETVTVSGLLSADGGHGGTGDSLEGDGGGGGGGGRIKVFSKSRYLFHRRCECHWWSRQSLWVVCLWHQW